MLILDLILLSFTSFIFSSISCGNKSVAQGINKQFSKLKVQEIEGRIEKELREDPESGDLIEGTHGLRKLRVSDGNKGKSGSLRVLYLDIKSKERIYIIAFFS